MHYLPDNQNFTKANPIPRLTLAQKDNAFAECGADILKCVEYAFEEVHNFRTQMGSAYAGDIAQNRDYETQTYLAIKDILSQVEKMRVAIDTFNQFSRNIR